MICNLHARSSPTIGRDDTVYVGSSWKDEQGNWYGYLHAFGAGGKVIADANGPYYGFINVPIKYSGSASFGYPPYSWFWNFGDGSSTNKQNPIYFYIEPGNYTIYLTVTDNSGNISDSNTWSWIQESNDPPNKPLIYGESKGKIGQSYNYTFGSIDSEGAVIWYFIEWGDGSDTGWIGPFTSGKNIIKSHSWTEKDNYTIRCKVKDPYNDESEWEELKITMSKNQKVLSFFKMYYTIRKFTRGSYS
jgi:hypothetical protein